MRVGKQIVNFTNQFVATKIQLIPSISHKKEKRMVIMPEESVEKLRKFVF